MQAWIDKFVVFLVEEQGSSANTVSAYKSDLNQFSKYLGSIPINRIDLDMIEKYSIWLRNVNYSPTTVARRIATLRSFFDFLHDQGFIEKNPTLNLNLSNQTVIRPNPRVLSIHQINLIIDLITGNTPLEKRDRALLSLLFTTGLKSSEVKDLNREDLGLSDRGLHISMRDKKGRERLIALDANTAAELKDYLELSYSVLTKSFPKQNALFVSQVGQRLTRQGIWYIIKRAAGRVGLEKEASPIVFRHSFAVHQLELGFSLDQVKELLGHASLTSTQIYEKVS